MKNFIIKRTFQFFRDILKCIEVNGSIAMVRQNNQIPLVYETCNLKYQFFVDM